MSLRQTRGLLTRLWQQGQQQSCAPLTSLTNALSFPSERTSTSQPSSCAGLLQSRGLRSLG